MTNSHCPCEFHMRTGVWTGGDDGMGSAKSGRTALLPAGDHGGCGRTWGAFVDGLGGAEARITGSATPFRPCGAWPARPPTPGGKDS